MLVDFIPRKFFLQNKEYLLKEFFNIIFKTTVLGHVNMIVERTHIGNCQICNACHSNEKTRALFREVFDIAQTNNYISRASSNTAHHFKIIFIENISGINMHEFELSYREVIPDQTNIQIRKDIIINTGLYFRGYVIQLNSLHL